MQLIAELRKQQQDRQKTIPKHPLPRHPLSQFTKPKYSRDEQLKLGKEEVLHCFDNPTDEPVFDRFNTRWVKCERCNNILSSDQMASYGGRGKAHLGICRECSFKK
ncbi:MAG: hypothetical protein IIW91_01245 [Alistipes sp.]|nr:hypothetical protein [Alistipes sp.]